MNTPQNNTPETSGNYNLLAAITLAILGAIVWIYSVQIQDRDVVDRIANTVSEIHQEAQNSLDGINLNHPDSTRSQLRSLTTGSEHSFYYFQGDSLLAWTANGIGGIQNLGEIAETPACVEMSNGYYLINKREAQDQSLYVMSLIKNQFPFENDFLKNTYAKRFGINVHPKISTKAVADFSAIQLNDTPLFFIEKKVDHQESHFTSYLSFALLLISIIFLIRGLVMRFNILHSNPFYIIGFIIALALLRWTISAIVRALEFDGLQLFSPDIYGSSRWLPSLGDFLITSLFIFTAGYWIWRWVELYLQKDRPHKKWTAIGIAILYFGYAYMVNELFKGLIQNSEITFNINNFFNLSPYSLVGIAIIGFLLFASYYMAMSLVVLLRELSRSLSNQILYGAIAINCLLNLLFGIVDWALILWSAVLLLFTFIFFRKDRNVLSLRILLLAILSLYASYMFDKYSEIRDKKEMKILSERLSINSDVVAEELFTDVDQALLKGQYVKKMLADIDKNKEGFEAGIVNQFFKGYWNRYNINVFLYDSLNQPVLEHSAQVQEQQNDLDESIMQAMYSTQDGLYIVNPKDKHLCYLAAYDYEVDSVPYKMYLEFDYKFVTDELGFPELLIKGTSQTNQFNNYSIGRYLNDDLVVQKGSYNYRIKKSMETDGILDSIYSRRDYLHFASENEPFTVVLSRKKDTLINRLTDFTYLYSIFGILFVLLNVLYQLRSGEFSIDFSLQTKIQALVISIVLISLLFFGLGSYYYIVSQNQEKNENLLGEKVSSVLIELSHKIDKEQAMNDDKKIASYLAKFSNVFFTDINIFALDGKLRASSRPQLTEAGLISNRMDPQAFHALVNEKKSRYTHSEQIGELEYLSSYVPFYGKNYEVLAYLNLPYFAKQAELEQELSAFVVTIINMLVILFILSAFGALMVSRLITSPLKVIEDNLSGMSLEKTNRPITYNGRDEIATLVNAYNTKLDELQQKAEELAKSERETAWREMAKQVAHEIKNPLTPMKLSIQYLQRAWQDKSEDWEERFNRSTTTLIEQIDTLSSIATAFGDFAKMPKAKLQKLDLASILEDVISLFAENEAEVDIELINKLEGPQYITADKDQMIRVFNNLVKNAIQSIPEDRPGRVEVSLIFKGFQYIVEVKDNGTGIPEDKQDLIFVPNFTTKSTGTGLGLAMVKSIVEGVDGKVWFNTTSHGTSFFVSLNQAEAE